MVRERIVCSRIDGLPSDQCGIRERDERAPP
jgi:hypothetical protein